MADRVSRRGKRKTVQFRGTFVSSIVFYFYNIFLIMYFITTIQTLFKDQLDQSKATCPFKYQEVYRQLMLLDLFTNMVTFVQGDSEIHDTSYFDIITPEDISRQLFFSLCRRPICSHNTTDAVAQSAVEL